MKSFLLQHRLKSSRFGENKVAPLYFKPKEFMDEEKTWRTIK